MRKPVNFRHQQRGAVAVMTGLLLLLVLVPLGGLVLDLGHLYIAKAELQNGADAAALAAAKDLDNTSGGVDKAITNGQAIGRSHHYNFDTQLTLDEAAFSFSDSPDGPWKTAGEARVAPASMTFVKVETGSKTLSTYLMRVAGEANTSTFGTAVAGRFVTLITPIGVCAADPDHRTSKFSYSTGVTELVEFGFRRGVAYNTFSLGSLGGATYDPYLINPVSQGSGSCDAGMSSANKTAPFVCNGNSAVLTAGVGTVYTNTGLSASIEKALNSRFNDFTGSPCVAAQAPPDANIKEFKCRGTGTGCINGAVNASTMPPTNWMEPGGDTYPNSMAVSTRIVGSASVPNYPFPSSSSGGPSGGTYANFANYGPLWTYTRPAHASAAATPAASGTFSVAEAEATRTTADPGKMYGTSATSYFDTSSASKYPNPTSTNANDTPYYQKTDSNYWETPSGSVPGVSGRRVLNLVLVDCRSAPVPSPGASCGKMNAVGIGKFFMLSRADLTSGTKKLYVEFVGLVEPVPDADVKLYR